MVAEKFTVDQFLDTRCEVEMKKHCPHKLPIRYDKFDKMHVIGGPKINPEVGNLILDPRRKNMKYIK